MDARVAQRRISGVVSTRAGLAALAPLDGMSVDAVAPAERLNLSCRRVSIRVRVRRARTTGKLLLDDVSTLDRRELRRAT